MRPACAAHLLAAVVAHESSLAVVGTCARMLGTADRAVIHLRESLVCVWLLRARCRQGGRAGRLGSAGLGRCSSPQQLHTSARHRGLLHVNQLCHAFYDFIDIIFGSDTTLMRACECKGDIAVSLTAAIDHDEMSYFRAILRRSTAAAWTA